MLNFQDPNMIVQETRAYASRAVVRLWHAFHGIFLWEFFTTLDFEWSVIRGSRPYRWTIWIYSLTRIATLIAVILDIVELDIYTPINCLLWIIFELIFSYFALAYTSLLLMLRVVAIWIRNKIILALATIVSSSALAGGPEISHALVLASGIVRICSGSVWIPEERCKLSNSDTTKLNAISTLATDSMLLLMMLAGLLHLRMQGGGRLSLEDFLWKQGLIWFLLAVVAEVPPTMFLKFKLLLTLTFGERHLQVLEVEGNRTVPNAASTTDAPSDSFPCLKHSMIVLAQTPSPLRSLFPYRFGRSTAAYPSSSTHPTGTLKFSASLRAKHVASFKTLTVFAARATHPFILSHIFFVKHHPALPGPPPPQRFQTAGAMLCRTSCLYV
ncbi:hypothetical protein BGW80DRAFT_1562420 [Lactifluus volemus]|nr:hypothetical protein BGW80DRAFT_1562420 [Lactifluus volemus]